MLETTALAPDDVQFVTIHGHQRAFVKMGQGPALLLLHGMGCNHDTWLPVLKDLAKRYTVIAPDLLGHGLSDKPRADYSVGGYANGMRDLLSILDIERVTVVGHSLGGGVAMQFAYQFPERTERLVLVAPGGVGPEVTPVIRAVNLPFWHEAIGLATLPGVRHATIRGMQALGNTGLAHTRDLGELADIFENLKDPQTRRAFGHVVRAVVDLRGQIATMVDRAYLTEAMPILVIWGEHDQVIPAHHADRVRRIAPGAVVEVLPNSGHFPHKDHPERFVKTLNDFIRNSRPAAFDREKWRDLLRHGPVVSLSQQEGLAEITSIG